MAEEKPHNQLVLRKTIVLVGMMGAGKTAVGRTLAAQLGVPFLDSDHEIEAAADRSIAEIFARDGEPFFRQKESQVIERLLEGTPGVLSTGGGAYMAEANRQMITQKGVAIWLDADLDVLWERVRHKDTRPLLRTDNPKQTLTDLYAKRVPIYRLADMSVTSASGISLEEMGRRVQAALADQRPDVLETVA
jgi:shikimate kinase